MNNQTNITREMLYGMMNFYEDGSVKDAIGFMIENHEQLQLLSVNNNNARETAECASKRAALHHEIVQLFYLFKEAYADLFVPEQIFQTEMLYFLATQSDAASEAG